MSPLFCARHCHKNASTNKSGTKSHLRSAGRGAARLRGAGDIVPECTVCPAATTSGVPANCAVQLALPHAPSPSVYINPTASKTARLRVQYLPLAHILNRPHSTQHRPQASQGALPLTHSPEGQDGCDPKLVDKAFSLTSTRTPISILSPLCPLPWQALRALPGGGDLGGGSSAKGTPGKAESSSGGQAQGHSAPVEPGLLLGLLLNISACALQLRDPHAALQYAAAAAAVEPNSGKAYYRAALALDALGHEDVAEVGVCARSQDGCACAAGARLACAPGPRRAALCCAFFERPFDVLACGGRGEGAALEMFARSAEHCCRPKGRPEHLYTHLSHTSTHKLLSACFPH